MKLQGCNLPTLFLASLIITPLCSSANAAVYHFTQTGFAGGGAVTGSFEATDDDNNGYIDSWNDVSFKNFQLSFSGDSLVGDFNARYVTRITYKIGTGVIGMDFDGSLASWIDTAGAIDPAPPYDMLHSFSISRWGGGRAYDYINGTSSFSTDTMYVTVSDVPLPAALGLFGMSLIGLYAGKRSSRPV